MGRGRGVGGAALRGARLEGFLVGAPGPGGVWGANVWIESAGHAAEAAETVRDLYAFSSRRWVDEGRTRHYALVPASDVPLVDAWFRLSFGLQHAHAAREVPARGRVRLPAGFEIRAPAPGDIDALVDVGLALPAHQRGSPVFTGMAAPDREAARREWLSTLEEPDEELVIAFTDGRPAACWSLTRVQGSRDHQPLMRCDNACFLGFASILPEYRRLGLGSALTEACFARAAADGYAVVVTDWRVTNLLASRFWPRLGFRETFFRMYRSIP